MVSRCLFNTTTRLARHSRLNLRQSTRTLIAVTGIQPSGGLHLGNYLSVLKPLSRLSSGRDEISELYFFIADLHALTTFKSPALLQSSITQLACTALACGIANVRDSLNSRKRPMTHVFLQSSIYGHTELAWLLASICSLPRLTHLPQWREKSQLDDQSPSVGLLTYPILQAADILLYRADCVPVGGDQIAHIELARDLYRSLIGKWPQFESLFTLPSPLLLGGGSTKVASLTAPGKKMSKSTSGSDQGVIWLSDPPDTIQFKVKRAVTDSVRGISYDPLNRPALANLIRILAGIEDCEIEVLMESIGSLDKQAFKSRLADALVGELDPIRLKVDLLASTPDGLAQITNLLSEGARHASLVANRQLEAIKTALGLIS